MNGPRKSKGKLEIGAKGGPQAPTPRPRAGVQFGPPPAKAGVAAQPEKHAPAPRAKPPRQKIDTALIAKARELRDRYLEQANDRMLIAPRAKYEMSRTLVDNPVASKALPWLKAG